MIPLSKTSILAWWFSLVALAMVYLAWLAAWGYMPPSGPGFQGQVMSLASGQESLSHFVSTYPNVAYTLAGLLQGAIPAVPATLLVTAAVAATLIYRWMLGLRRARYSWPVTVLFVLLLALNPIFLRVLAMGPDVMVLMLSFYMLASGLYGVRANAAAPDVMLVGGGLTVMAFAHPLGLIMLLASLPLLPLIAPPEALGRSALGFYTALLFPVVFGLLAFAYICWLFTGEAWTFLAGLKGAVSSDTASPWQAGAGGDILLTIGMAMVGLAAAFPALIASLIAMGRRLPLIMPALTVNGTVLATVLLGTLFGIVDDPALPLAFGASATALALRHWPLNSRRPGITLLLLVAGLFGGGLMVSNWSSADGRAWQSALVGEYVDTPQQAALNAGLALVGQDDVLVDTDAMPALITGRGYAIGLVTPTHRDFRLSELTRQLKSRFVVVPDPHSPSADKDRISRSFPRLYEEGVPGYERVYDAAGWRIFVRRQEMRL